MSAMLVLAALATVVMTPAAALGALPQWWYVLLPAAVWLGLLALLVLLMFPLAVVIVIMGWPQ